MEKIILVSKKDLQVSWFNGGGGGGGQNRNRHNNCCRIHHPESGATGTSSKHKEAESNKRDAFLSLTNSIDFKKWMHLKLEEIRTKQTLEERVENQMKEYNLKIETIVDGQWVELEQ